MLSKEKIENDKIPKQLAKALGIEKEDTDSLIAFKESLFEQTVYENIILKKQIEQLESDKQKLIEKLEEKKFKIKSTYSQINGNYFMAQDRLDLINEILEILKGENHEQ